MKIEAVDYKNSFAVSFAFHGAIVLLFLAVTHFKFTSYKNVRFTVIESAVKVDIVAMPKMTIQELKHRSLNPPKLGNEEPVSEKIEVVTKGDEFLKEKKKKSFADLMKQYGKKKIKKSSKRKLRDKGKEGGEINSYNEDLDQLVLAGNQLSQGTSVTGSGNQVALTELLKYAGHLPDLIKPFWKLPSYLLDNQKLKCRVRIYIGKNGDLLRHEILESSDEDEFDQKALSAVKKAAPFPEPPSDVVAQTSRGEIVLGFPL